MIVQANAKINWTLAVTGKYENGYHELDMLMQSISLADTLSIEKSENLTLTVNGKEDPLGDKNLVMKAAKALLARTEKPLGAALSLTKRIPSQAGLGGGSADCAAALSGLNRFWELGLSREELLTIGAKLGADVPFCLAGGLARVRGFGERIEPIECDRKIPILLAKPEKGLSTSEVFSAFDGLSEKVPVDTERALSLLLAGDLNALQGVGRNHLEDAALSMLPEIALYERALAQAGASYARMTGSGSCVFGAFDSEEKALAAQKALPFDSIFATTL